MATSSALPSLPSLQFQSTGSNGLTRRGFGKLSLSALALFTSLGSLVVTTGCGIVADLLKYIPVALQAITGIVSVLTGGGIALSPLVNEIIRDAQAAFANLSADITAYENAPAVDKTTFLGKVSTALAIAEGNIQQFWAALNIPDAVIATVVAGVLGVIVSTLSYFASQLPTPAPSPALAAMQAKRGAIPGSKLLNVPAKKRSLKQFKSDLNSAFGNTGVKVY
jgi:hypothetical protein